MVQIISDTTYREEAAVLFQNGVPAEDDSRYGFVQNSSVSDRDDDGLEEVMVKFPRRELAESLASGENVSVTVTGDVGERTFKGRTEIRVLNKGGKSNTGNGNSSGNGSGSTGGSGSSN